MKIINSNRNLIFFNLENIAVKLIPDVNQTNIGKLEFY